MELYKEGPETYQFGHQKESVYYSWAIRKFCLTIKIYIYDSSAIDTRGLYLLVMGQALKIQTKVGLWMGPGLSPSMNPVLGP